MKRNKVTGSIIFTALAFLVIFSLGSCARKLTFAISPVVPGAQGSVKIKRDRNNNYAIDIRIKNLADAKRLSPPENTYVVWIETPQNGTKNIGQLVSSAGLFSSTLKASLRAVTPFRPVSVFITAESSADITYPGPQVVLRTSSYY